MGLDKPAYQSRTIEVGLRRICEYGSFNKILLIKVLFPMANFIDRESS